MFEIVKYSKNIVFGNSAKNIGLYKQTLINKIELVDLTGKVVYAANIQLYNGSVDLKGIAKGM